MYDGGQGAQPQQRVLPESTQATTVFVLGLLGLLMCQPLGIFAWVMGRNEQKRVDAGLVARNDLLKAGTILGMIATIFFGVWLLAVAAWFGFLVLIAVIGAAGASAGGMLPF